MPIATRSFSSTSAWPEMKDPTVLCQAGAAMSDVGEPKLNFLFALLDFADFFALLMLNFLVRF
jgi:hypothetical protein